MPAMKLCISCGVKNGPKPIDEFHYRNRSKGTRQDRCKECAKAYAKKEYEANKEQRIKQINDRQLMVRAQNKKTYAEFLEKGECSVCQEADTRCLTSTINHDDILYKSILTFEDILSKAIIKCLNCTAKDL